MSEGRGLEKMDVPAPAEIKLPFSPSFCSGWALPRLGDGHPPREETCLPQFTNSVAETSSQAHPEILFYQPSGHALARSGWHMEGTSTVADLVVG